MISTTIKHTCARLTPLISEVSHGMPKAITTGFDVVLGGRSFSTTSVGRALPQITFKRYGAAVTSTMTATTSRSVDTPSLGSREFSVKTEDATYPAYELQRKAPFSTNTSSCIEDVALESAVTGSTSPSFPKTREEWTAFGETIPSGSTLNLEGSEFGTNSLLLYSVISDLISSGKVTTFQFSNQTGFTFMEISFLLQELRDSSATCSGIYLSNIHHAYLYTVLNGEVLADTAQFISVDEMAIEMATIKEDSDWQVGIFSGLNMSNPVLLGTTAPNKKEFTTLNLTSCLFNKGKANRQTMTFPPSPVFLTVEFGNNPKEADSKIDASDKKSKDGEEISSPKQINITLDGKRSSIQILDKI